MKKVLALMLALVLVLGCLAACKTEKKTDGEQKQSDASAQQNEQQPDPEPKPEPEPEPVPETTPEPEPEPAPAPAPEPVDAHAKLIAAMEKNQNTKSMHMDVDMDMALNISIPDAGFTQPYSIQSDMHMDLDNVRNMSEGTMKISMLGQSVDAISYTETIGDTYVSYTSADNGKTWEVSTQSTDDYSNVNNPADLMKVYKENLKDVAIVGTGSVNGRETTAFTGVLKGESIMFMAGSIAGIADYSKSDMQAIMKEIGDIPFEAEVDNGTGYLVHLKADMSDAMTSFMKKLMEEELKKTGTALSVEVSDSKVFMNAFYSQFDEIGEIVIPAEARAARG